MANMTKRKTREEFIEEAKTKHLNEDGTPKYIYSKTEYQGSHDKLIITCPIHGDFEQVAKSHLSGCGCPKCNHRSYAYSKEEFINLYRLKPLNI